MDYTQSSSSSQLFSNIAKKDYLNFGYRDSFRSEEVARFLDFSPDDISKIARVKKPLRLDRLPLPVRERLEQIGNICNLVAEAFDGDVARAAMWFKTTNPMLGNTTPRDMIRLGRYNKLIQFILNALEETNKSQ